MTGFPSGWIARLEMEPPSSLNVRIAVPSVPKLGSRAGTVARLTVASEKMSATTSKRLMSIAEGHHAETGAIVLGNVTVRLLSRIGDELSR
jgi:hypothetical protein